MSFPLLCPGEPQPWPLLPLPTLLEGPVLHMGKLRHRRGLGWGFMPVLRPQTGLCAPGGRGRSVAVLGEGYMGAGVALGWFGGMVEGYFGARVVF